MSLTASLRMVSPDSSRTSAGPPTATSPVYVLAPISGLRSRVSPAVATVPGMDASGAVPAAGPVGRTATELAEAVRTGELSAVEVVRAHLAQIDAVDSRIGAFR